MGNGTRKQSAEMQYMKCIISAMLMAFKRCGHICGHAGIHPKCGASGHVQHHHTFHTFTLR
jgi:hypothetical protein